MKLKSNEAWDLEVEWEKVVVKVEGGGGVGKVAVHPHRCFPSMAFHFSSFSSLVC